MNTPNPLPYGPSWPNLNWKEWRGLAPQLEEGLTGMYVDRVFIPGRPETPEGYLKNEWVIRLVDRGREVDLVLGVRARQTYLYKIATRSGAQKLKPTPNAKDSAFGQSLSKQLKGARLEALEALPRERICVLWWRTSNLSSDLSSHSPQEGRLGLILSMIPATPEALLVRAEITPKGSTETQGRCRVLSRSRVKLGNSAQAETYILPDGKQAPEDLEVRTGLVDNVANYAHAVESALERDALEARCLRLTRVLRDERKACETRGKQSRVALTEAEGEADWKRMGDLMKANLIDEPPIRKNAKGKAVRVVQDFSHEDGEGSGKLTEIPADPELGVREQMEKFYQMAKRKARRIEEARSRAEAQTQRLSQISALESELKRALEGSDPMQQKFALLSKLESSLGIATSNDQTHAEAAKQRKRAGTWEGRRFTSKDGMMIWVGKTRDENLELTFKHARGNDTWMHVRGKPGAHVVIPNPSGKSTPLETLLDAAQLCIFYSGGENWSTTEVDYTFKKFVKRIKNSHEASYTQNRTLLIQKDPERLKRLLGN